MQKPTKPSVTLPDSFGGTKYEFDADRLLSGYKEGVKDVVDGGNLNYLIDSIGKIVNYNKQITDFIRDMPIGKITTVDTNNNLVYAENKMTLPVGSLQSSTLPLMDNIQYVLADGTQYSTTGVYQAFADYLAQVKLTHPQCFVTQAEFDADVASTGQCGRYVLDTVNFRVPKITRYIGATVNLADIGKAWSESLPDHIHNITNGYGGQAIGGGNISQASPAFTSIFNTKGVNNNPTYRNGAKVNPERVTYPYYIVTSNAGQMTPVEIDINNVISDLAVLNNAKLDKTGDNATSETLQNIASNADATGKETIVGWGMPDYSAGVSKTWNTNITAKNYGVVIANARADQSTTLKAIVNSNQLPYNELANYGTLSISFAVSKGDVYKVYGANGTGTIVFYPLKGVN